MNRRNFLPWLLSPLAALWPWKAKAHYGQPGIVLDVPPPCEVSESSRVGDWHRGPDTEVDGIARYSYSVDGARIEFNGGIYSREQAESIVRETPSPECYLVPLEPS